MKLLAFDSSTDACSVALVVDGNVSSRFELAPRRHTQLLLPMAHELMAEAATSLKQLDGVAFGHGPGSFTGIRITVGLVQGLAMGLDCPVHGISTLEALAARSMRLRKAKSVAVAMDARMNQVYWGQYQQGDDGKCREVARDQLLDPGDAPSLDRTQWHAAGTGWQSYAEKLTQATGLIPDNSTMELFPHAEDIALLALERACNGSGIKAAHIQPVYLRQQVAEKMHRKDA